MNHIDYSFPNIKDAQWISECRIISQWGVCDVNSLYMQHEVDKIARQIASNWLLYRVAKHDDIVVWYVNLITKEIAQSLSYYWFDNNYDLELSRLFVLPQYQREWVGISLLKKALEQVKWSKNIYLHTLGWRYSANQFYKKIWFIKKWTYRNGEQWSPTYIRYIHKINMLKERLDII